MQQILEFFNIHFAPFSGDFKVLLGNTLIIIGVLTILFFAFVETEPDVAVPVVSAETKKSTTPKKTAAAAPTTAKKETVASVKKEVKSSSTTPVKSPTTPAAAAKKSTAKKAKKAVEELGHTESPDGRRLSSRIATRTPRAERD